MAPTPAMIAIIAIIELNFFMLFLLFCSLVLPHIAAKRSNGCVLSVVGQRRDTENKKVDDGFMGQATRAGKRMRSKWRAA